VSSVFFFLVWSKTQSWQKKFFGKENKKKTTNQKMADIPSPSFADGGAADMSSVMYASCLSVQIHASSSVVPRERARAAEALRTTYLAIFNEQENDPARKKNQSWWIEPFRLSANAILQQFLSEKQESSSVAAAAPAAKTTITICHDGVMTEFDAKKDSVVLVGRRPESHVVLHKSGSSRLHAVIFLFPELGKLLVVDVGSETGVVTQARQHQNLPLQSSLPIDRKTIELEWGESAVLVMGSEIITVTPRECVVCLDKPRTCKLACQHFATCDDCTDRLPGNKCPLCRVSVFPVQRNIAAIHTNEVPPPHRH